MRLTLILVALLIIGTLVFCFWGKRSETYRDANVLAGEITAPVNTFAVHLSKPQYLTINGKTYMGVRGLPPYYLDVPELNSILFVTQEKDGKVLFHLVNLKNKKEIQINADSSGFGWDIGSGRKPGDKYTDYVENVQSNQIMIATRSGDWKEMMVLNLANKSIARRETIYFDSTGQITNRSVQTNIAPAGR